MTPPKTPGASSNDAFSLGRSSAVSLCQIAPQGDQADPADKTSPGAPPAPARIEVLRKRPDFLRAASARRQAATGFLLQARHRGDDSPAIRIGFTATKKVGNAVTRNRAKRRLRALAQAIVPRLGLPGWDYVLVARPGVTPDRDFALLQADLTKALSQIHRSAPA